MLPKPRNWIQVQESFPAISNGLFNLLFYAQNYFFPKNFLTILQQKIVTIAKETGY